VTALTIPRFFLAASSLAIALGAAACTTSTTTTVYTPITGIQIPSATIVSGYGCGAGADQVYRYAAVISAPVGDAATSSVLASSVFPCFSDGVFSNLPVSTTSAFSVAIYAFNQASFPTALDCTSSPCPGDDAGAVAAAIAAANWTTTCTGTEIAGVTAIATCPPLQPTAAAPGGSAGDSGAEGAADDGPTGDDAGEDP
jgi:hypothetical protein